VACVSFSPTADTAASADAAGRVLWWDLRSPGPVASLDAPARAAVAFDEQGLVVGVAGSGAGVHLYSAAELARGPFLTLPLGPPAGFGAAAPDRLAFDARGRALVATGGGSLAVVDAFRGGAPLLRAVPGPPPPGCPPLTPAFSPDGGVVVSGCHDCAIRAWRLPEDGGAAAAAAAATPGGLPPSRPVAEWTGHSDAPAALAWAPGKALVAAGCHALALWQPAR